MPAHILRARTAPDASEPLHSHLNGYVIVAVMFNTVELLAVVDGRLVSKERTMNDLEYQHLLGKARDAKQGGRDAWCVQSTGEKVAVALVLNRADWLASIDYTIPEAIERIGPEWFAHPLNRT